MADLTKFMKQSLNFTTTRVQPEDGFWGAKVIDEETNETSWTGMVRQLKDKEVDFCGSSLALSTERQTVKQSIQHRRAISKNLILAGH